MGTSEAAQAAHQAHSPLGAARRELLAGLDGALKALRRRSPSERDIHRIRKDLKRARAALRLLRQCIGDRAYRHDNAAMRDAARPLMALRDGQALLQTLDKLKGAALQEDAGRFAARLRRELRDQKLAERRRLRARILRRSAAVLQPIRRRIAALPSSDLDAAQPVTGLERAYKNARKAGERAHEERTNDRLHEWRKQTKYLDNQLDMLKSFGPRLFARSRKRAHKLADRLGDDHDLAVLQAQIDKFTRGNPGQPDGAAALLSQLHERRQKLQRRAFRVGRRLYLGKPKRYQP